LAGPTEALINHWNAADDVCRSAPPSSQKGIKACAARDAEFKQLEALGYCYTGVFGADYHWEFSGSRSQCKQAQKNNEEDATRQVDALNAPAAKIDNAKAATTAWWTLDISHNVLCQKVSFSAKALFSQLKPETNPTISTNADGVQVVSWTNNVKNEVVFYNDKNTCTVELGNE
jgi:hypothetical protein